MLTGPAFTQALAPHTTVTITGDKEVRLTCEVECDPPCQLGWYREGEYIKSSDGETRGYSVNSAISYQNIYR